MKFKSVIIGLMISLTIFLLLVACLVAFDIYLHSRFKQTDDINFMGYRGKVVGKKRPDEVRIGLFGGSIVMGYRVFNEKSIAGFMQKFIDDDAWTRGLKRKYTVINLGVIGEPGCQFFKPNYMATKYLDLDVAIFYFAKDSGNIKNLQMDYCERTKDVTIGRFNYHFIFPLLLREKYYLWRYGDITKGYLEDKFFKNIDSFFSARKRIPKIKQTMAEFIKEAISKDNKVFILAVSPPAPGDPISNKIELTKDLKLEFKDNPKAIIADLTDIFPGGDSSPYIIDSDHYNEKGNSAVARALLKYIPYHLYEK